MWLIVKHIIQEVPAYGRETTSYKIGRQIFKENHKDYDLHRSLYYILQRLPKEYFCIKKDIDNPLWGNYIKWLKGKPNGTWDIDSPRGIYFWKMADWGYFRQRTCWGELLTLKDWDYIINPPKRRLRRIWNTSLRRGLRKLLINKIKRWKD